MKSVILEKKDGVIKKLEVTPELLKLLENSKGEQDAHLCIDCQNCRPYRCSKVDSRIKKTINRYEFIKEGLQQIDEEGKIARFKVTKCDNFVRDVQKQPTKAEKSKIRQARRGIRMYHFGAETLEDTYIIQAESGLPITKEESKVIDRITESRLRERLENMSKPWLSAEEIKKYSNISVEEGQESYEQAYNSLIDKKQAEEKEKTLKK